VLVAIESIEERQGGLPFLAQRTHSNPKISATLRS
jgi:hypothetical protein